MASEPHREKKKLHLPPIIWVDMFLFPQLFLLAPAPAKCCQIKYLEYRETSNFGYFKVNYLVI